MNRTGLVGQVCAHAKHETAGSAAAPAARCRKFRRGVFIGHPRVCPPAEGSGGRSIEIEISDGLPAAGTIAALLSSGRSASPAGSSTSVYDGIVTFAASIAARMEPTGLAFGEPEDRLRVIRDGGPA
jgi:hypothetical protein